MYRCKRLAELKTWHVEGKNKDSKIKSVVDSKAWKHVDARWPESAKEPRNLRMALALDGVNLFSNQSLSYSTWPIVFVKLQLATLVGYQTVFCDATPNHSQQR